MVKNERIGQYYNTSTSQQIKAEKAKIQAEKAKIQAEKKAATAQLQKPIKNPLSNSNPKN